MTGHDVVNLSPEASALVVEALSTGWRYGSRVPLGEFLLALRPLVQGGAVLAALEEWQGRGYQPLVGHDGAHVWIACDRCKHPGLECVCPPDLGWR